MNNPNILTVLQEADEWKTEFDGDITQVQINGVEILKIHNLTKEVSKVGRQVRVLAIMGTTLALACLVIVSVILGRKIETASLTNEVMSDLANTKQSRIMVLSRLYETTGNIWDGDKWIIDPKWQQTANKPLSPTEIDD